MTRFLITGVNRGIGQALAARALRDGHDVIGTTRDGRGDTLAVSMDRPGDIDLPDIGPIDVLINNAGTIGPARQSTLDMDFDAALHTFAVNALAPLAVAQATLPALRRGTQPRILSVSSQMAWMGYQKSDRIAYRASKAALNKLMQGLATDLAPEGITVAVVDPGWVRTDMGGAEADEDPADVACGILALALRLSLADSGTFFRFTGEKREY
jgi:NAD(P)-dependent dehydrogenase (short-subunit alcohol dehydrogenase family)